MTPAEMIQLVAQFGIPGVLVVVLTLIIHDPNRAEKIKALIFSPTHRLFRWGSKQYLAAKVGSTATEFLRRYLGKFLSNYANLNVAIRWVKSASDPILTQDGTLILCLEDTNDQTRNILAATRVALPHVVCPLLRSNLKDFAQSAIDLAVLQKLTDGLGRHARPVFQKYFLSPELGQSKDAAELFVKLVEIDARGLFVAIFLEELDVLGERLFDAGDVADRTIEVVAFLEFLLTLARRKIGEDIETRFVSNGFRVGVILVAKTRKAETQGVSPYLNAISFDVERGCESIYLIGFAPAVAFLKRLMDIVDGDTRFFVVKRKQVKIRPHAEEGASDSMIIALLRMNAVFSEATIADRIAESGLTVGDLVDGTVLDVSKNVCVVDVNGMTCSVYKTEASWNTINSCEDALSSRKAYKFIVKAIDKSNGRIELTRRVPTEDPWHLVSPPSIGDYIEVTFMDRRGTDFLTLSSEGLEVLVPREELTWLGIDTIDDEKVIGSKHIVFIYSNDDVAHEIKGSIRLTEHDPWPSIHKRLTKGAESRGTVTGVSSAGVSVRIEGGFVGIVPPESMTKAGFEYVDYQKNVVVGQGLDVVVTKVFIARRRIRFDLKRNVEAPSPDKK